jgi:DNA-directed RNA polymerase subunit M/transcription elongation factor TFIIS
MTQMFENRGVPVKDRTVPLFIARQLEIGCRTFVVQEINSSSHALNDSSYAISVLSGVVYEIADLLRDPSCELITAILSERLRAHMVPHAVLADICPSVLRAERDEVELRKKQKIEQKTSSVFTCKKCKVAKTLVREAQTRSSDEAPTLVIQCVGCGNCWTQSS